jgi:integrase
VLEGRQLEWTRCRTTPRERWLSADELAAFKEHCPTGWWPFFAVLFYTGARLGEVQGLRGADVLVHAKRITIHESERRVKSKESVRDLPIPEPLEQALAMHFARVPVGHGDFVFPGAFQEYDAVRQAWDATCNTARITGATPHDARHTFGVHAAQTGVPIARLQRLMGHATATMTLRYMRHAPEAYLDEDAKAIAGHMKRDPEVEVRSSAARSSIRTA